MRNKLTVFIMVITGIASSVHGLDGRVITVTGGQAVRPYTPVSVPCDGPRPDGAITAVSRATGQAAPATLLEGRLIFVPAEPVEPGNRFEIKVGKPADKPRVRLEHDAGKGTVAVYVRDEHFTTYHYGDDVRIPFLWPVHAEGGVTITRNYPMGTDEPVSIRDHRHHVSLWTAFGDVNRADTWHRTPIRTRQIQAISGDALGLIRAHNVWYDNDNNPLVDEMREYRFYDGPAGVRFIDQTITFVAAHGEVTFGDNKEGLVAFRIRPEIQGNHAGRLTNSEGKQGEKEVYGTPVPWMDYSGPVEGVGNRGIALFSHPDNFRLPCWHVRDYGLFTANPFALSGVGRLDKDGAHTLAPGERLALTYRFYVHSGDVKEARVAQRYADFAKGPELAWAE